MSDRNDRSDRLSRRLNDEPDDDEGNTADAGETEPGSDTSDTGEAQQQSSQPADDKPSKPSSSSNPSKTDMPAETDDADTTSVKDRPSVLMYLPEDLRQEMDIRFDELNAAAKREFGEGLEKNRHWYPIIISMGLEKAKEKSDTELLARLREEGM